jgi:hypothetical protein
MRVVASCLCGGVRFTLPGPVGDITACHCSQCRRASGHFAASFDIEGDIDYVVRETLGTYETPKGAMRGFCTRCGSSLWFRDVDGEVSVEAGAVDGLTGSRLTSHICVDDKGDYYDIDDTKLAESEYGAQGPEVSL